MSVENVLEMEDSPGSSGQQCYSPYITVGDLPLAAWLISASHARTHQPGVSLDVGQASWECIIAEIGDGAGLPRPCMLQ